VDSDTAVTPDGDGHRERDQLAGLPPEQIGRLARGSQRLIALDRVGAEPGNFTDPHSELLAIGVPVEHRHVASAVFGQDKRLPCFHFRLIPF
jgi:hypothetical protein